MKTIRKLKWYFLFLILIGLNGSRVFAQNENGPISNYTEIVYLNLDAGNVTITSSTYEGYRWSGNTPVKISGSASSSALYYIYQARPNTSWGPGNPPRYPAVTTTSGATGSGALNIVNNTDVMAVINGWNAKVASNNAAQSNENYKRYPTSNWINVSCHARINICLDNIWSTHQGNNSGTTEGGLSFVPSDPNPERYCRLNVYLKGDSRMGNVYYSSHAIPDNGSEEYLDYTNSHIIFRSADGNGAVTGTLTVADIDPINQTHNFTLPNTDPNATSYTIRVTANHYNSVIGGSDSPNLQDSRGIDIKGGTIFAGALFEDNCTAIGAGGNGVGVVTIDGGQVTAVTSSTGTAIGGGIGWIDFGGEGHVTINGGKVYAYNHGVAYVYDDHLRYVPATAIGGGSSFRYPCNPCTVTITGGEVYAQSVGGVAIGGGGSGLQNAGHGTVNISNGIVTAKSINGTVTSSQMPAGMQTISVPAGAALGGGTGGLGTAYGGEIAYGGNATVNISGGQLFAGSVGGGAANDPNGKIGSATVRVTGGTSQAQFIMAGGSTGNCSFYMDNGIVQNSKTSSTEFILLRPDGGALWMDDTNGTATIKGGTIRGCEATNGGAIYMTGGSFEITGGTVGGSSIANGNKATSAGGAVYMGGGTFTMKGGYINYNTATNSNGGGVYIAPGGTVTINGGTILGNQALNGDGGGFYVNPGSSKITTINSNSANTIISSNSAKNGGGAFVNSGTLAVNATSSRDVTIQSNTASISGGGVYVNNGTVTFANAKLLSNVATNNDGGGFFLGSGSISVSGSGTAISGNTAKSHGGGVYVGGGGFSMTSGTIGGTLSQGNKTTGNTSYGGGLYMGGGTATISGGSISGNHTDSDGMGGGIYMNGGTCTLSNGTTIGGASTDYANSAKYGGGIYSAGGTITVKGGKIQRNTASTAGGGIYTNGAAGVVNMEKQTAKAEMLSYIEYNTAGEGGGIYANRGVVNFSDGHIQHNYASEAGGGIYVNDNGGGDYGTLYLKGSANLYRNHVPEGHDGGGVYLKGKVVVGEAGASGRIMAQENFAGDAYVYEWTDTGHPATDSIDQVTANNRNNIYLPVPAVNATHRTDVITVIENGISADSHVGFSVPHGNVPVIYCAYSPTSRDYLHDFSTGHRYQYNLFDDTRHYVAVQYSNQPDIFDPDHVYLYGFWSNIVTGKEDDEYCVIDPESWEDLDTIPISTPCELAFFISWVNGLNGLPGSHPDASARLVADIDMSDYGWVPIGRAEEGYSGVFDGNGHTVSGIVGLLYREYTDYGFFGKLAEGAVVKDLFIKGANFYLEENDEALAVGGLVGEMNGNAKVQNTEVSSIIYAENPTTVMGGLIGRMGHAGTSTPTVHSAIAIPTLTGHLMGGLVGQLEKGDLLNSFANTKFDYKGTTQYTGGLVAVNRGRVENCYAREQDGSSHGSNFGSLVGDNAGGTVRYSYAPQPTSQYTVTGKEGVLEGLGTYGTTYLPYLYKHRDTQVAATNDYVPTDANADKQMMNVLNNWVDAKSTASVTYTKWGRPWQESNAHKPLNDDYPILKMPMAEAVGAKAGDPYLYYNPVDSLLVRYTDAESAIWLYRNPADVVRGDNSSSEAKLYIAEDVALKNLNELKAYVGITLDNSAGGQGANPTYGEMLGITTDATDWHMISSPLMDAPIGINYSDNGSYDFSWGHPEGMPYYLFYQKGNLRNGYFPSHRFGESYPSSDATIEAGSYYNEWDFYAYSEPNYHWINFKRNSNSHRHFDTETHEPISYGNEPSLIPGKGYFAATREETFLQCQGHLNADEIVIGLTMTTGVPRHGYNLIGNPYQAYLDFDAFADANWGDDEENIWGEGETPSYTILDEDAASYLTFAYDGSDNPDAAGRFIHPHQGFFVRTGLNGSMAYFQPDMRNTTAQNSTFRSNDHIDYPLVNLFVSEANGNSDMVTVELGRPTQGGALLMQGLRAGNGKIWCHYNDVDYAVAYTQPGVTEAAIRFETVADTEYTMRWNTHNGDFSYLHLIDNVTGADVDCLTTDEYRFSANTSDYKSRFRLVFGYTGIEEDSEAEANENFAFIMNDALVVTGEGVLQVFDMTGRMVTSQELHGVQTTVSLPNAANGVYVLRLTEGKQSRIQKMVISK